MCMSVVGKRGEGASWIPPRTAVLSGPPGRVWGLRDDLLTQADAGVGAHQMAGSGALQVDPPHLAVCVLQDTGAHNSSRDLGANPLGGLSLGLCWVGVEASDPLTWFLGPVAECKHLKGQALSRGTAAGAHSPLCQEDHCSSSEAPNQRPWRAQLQHSRGPDRAQDGQPFPPMLALPAGFPSCPGLKRSDPTPWSASPDLNSAYHSLSSRLVSTAWGPGQAGPSALPGGGRLA